LAFDGEQRLDTFKAVNLSPDDSMIQGSIDDSTGSIWKISYLKGFLPSIFPVVLGFPNVVPTPNEWGDYFPIFRERKHLHEFHELMH
jgi:hypothetical protein